MKGIGLLFIGFSAQALFSARFLIQLVKSEKAGKVLSPTIFWQLSLIASFLLMVYGTLRSDIVIVGGQAVGYLIYIRNIQIKNDWNKISFFSRILLMILPIIFFAFLYLLQPFRIEVLFFNSKIDQSLLNWGLLGQLLFTGRFIIQWRSSEVKSESFFPLSFWYLSIIGSLMIASYAILREDVVLFIGQGFGLIVYIRNIIIGKRDQKY